MRELRVLWVSWMICLAGSAAAQAAGGDPKDTAGAMELRPVAALLWILVAGGFGGLADGIVLRARQEQANVQYMPYRLDLPFGHDRFVELGFIGHMLIGATASIAIFTVIDALSGFNFEFNNLDTTDFLRLLALGVLSGFAGIRILDPALYRLIGQVRGEVSTIKSDMVGQIKTEVQREGEQNTEVAELQKRGNERLVQYDLLSKMNKHDESREALQAANGAFEYALRLEPNDEVSLRGKARVLRRLAQLSRDNPSEALKIRPQSKPDDLWREAVDTLDLIIKRNPLSANSFYNRACYMALWKKKGIHKQYKRRLEEGY